MSLGAIGAGVQAATSLFNIFSGIGMLNKASKIKPDYYSFNDPRLKGMESQQAKDMLGRSQMQVNARTPGAAARDRQIQSSRAGTQAAIQRGAVDPSMALQAMLASQAQADDQSNNQFMIDAQMQQQREANLMGAQGTMISERDKALAERMGKYQMDMSQKNALMNAGQQSISSGGSAMASTFMGLGAQQQQQSYNKNYMDVMQNMYGSRSNGSSLQAPSAYMPSSFNNGLSSQYGGQYYANQSIMSNPFSTPTLGYKPRGLGG